MTDSADKTAMQDSRSDEEPSNWGPKLFVGTLVILLIFFWWLLVYSGGVSGHGG